MTNNPEFYPRYTRIEFEFYLSDNAKKSVAYTQLFQDTTKEIDAFKQQLKSRVIQATNIELTTLTEKAKLLFINSLCHLSPAFLILHCPTDAERPPVDSIVKEVIA